MDDNMFPPEPYKGPDAPSEKLEIETPNAVPNIDPAATPQPAGGSIFARMGWKIPTAVGVAILLLVGSVGFAYSRGYTLSGFRLLSPEAVWNKFYTKESSKIYHAKFTAQYEDPESTGESQQDFGFTLKNVKLSLEGNAYADITEEDNPAIDGTVKFTAGSGSTSFTSGVDYRAKDGVFYYKLGDIPIISDFLKGDSGQNIDWVKVNSKDLDKVSGDDGSDIFKDLNNNQELQQKIRQIWVDNRAIRLGKYIGREKLNGVNTMHFQAELDRGAAKKAVLDTITALTESDKGKITEDDKAVAEEITDRFFNKIEIKELDAWIGSSDDNLYRLHMLSNAPSAASLFKLAEDPMLQNEPQTLDEKKKMIDQIFDKVSFDATFKLDVDYSDYGKSQEVQVPENAYDILGQAQTAAGDAKRLADVRQIASALELYYNDNNWYPYGLNDLAPTYLGTVPTAPTPAGGSCTESDNTYNYKYFDSNHYELHFCLGAKTGGLEKGAHTLSQAGIQ
jgi:hypothetical protein